MLLGACAQVFEFQSVRLHRRVSILAEKENSGVCPSSVRDRPHVDVDMLEKELSVRFVRGLVLVKGA